MVYGEACESSNTRIDEEEEYSRRMGEEEDRNCIL